ncbi:MAG: phospholipid/cholesterol/gamma-HCH transport system substrate-binding protein [Pseudonocardiales bacterium]|jgi:phospholipid/cholesterol/gamma-HCH transport system substrate-binding protein|nr:phospholipid/cholesterol/gamma-HCH transport system substrate-binding protein [Pseudonocardiales bacterium]
MLSIRVNLHRAASPEELRNRCLSVKPIRLIAVAAVSGLLVLGTVVAVGWTAPYQVHVVLPSAVNVVNGGALLMNGFEAGTVSGIEVRNGQAYLTLSLDGDAAPLHDGAAVSIGWKAVLSERQIQITDGPSGNALIPNGGMLVGAMPKATEVDDVLDALDAPTRDKLRSLVGRLDGTLTGNEQNLNATLQTAGPAISSLGRVLQALGTDGPAIHNLVVRLNGMMGTLSDRDVQVRTIIDQLSQFSSQAASRQAQLRDTLGKLPPTLLQAKSTLDLVPEAVDQAAPLLDDLRPATAKLGPVAQNLRPLLQDLRPLTADLRPTLAAAQDLLDRTPGLLDVAHGTVPGLTTTVANLSQPAAVLRPLMPEAVAWASHWGSSMANYDGSGNYARVYFQEGSTSVTEMPSVTPPGVTYDPYPLPGAIDGQPWTDAFGDGLR